MHTFIWGINLMAQARTTYLEDLLDECRNGFELLEVIDAWIGVDCLLVNEYNDWILRQLQGGDSRGIGTSGFHP